jgi:enoyl-CoA hydratase
MTAAAQDLLCDVDRHIAYVTINREQRRNALSREVLQELPGVMTDLAEDPDVRVIVVSGAGERAFSAGADLKEMHGRAAHGLNPTTPMTGVYRNAFEAVLEIPKPTIASVNGYALAGGFELAMACDLRIAADTAEFGMPEARIGMGANFATVVLPRLIPRAIALELLYTGDRLPASRACSLGLVNQVVPSAELAERTRELADRIARNAPLSLQRFKEMATKGWELPVATALRLNAGPNPYTSQDRKEGVAAFLEKREPRWQGR